MRTSTRMMVMAALIAVAMLASTRVASAQDQLTVNVPFDFIAGSKTMPAGEYAVKSVGPTNMLILIAAADSTSSAFLPTHAAVSSQPQTESKLVFNRYGNRYFLAQVWTVGNSSGRQLNKSNREKEVALTASIETEGQVILVAGLPPTTR
jgi:hypothetical protein